MKNFAFLFALALSLPSCTPIYTQEYIDLEPYVDRAPQSNAVVGMWSRRVVSGNTTSINSLLFRSDRTGITKFTVDDSTPVLGMLGTGDVSGELGAFTWEYTGDGVWKLSDSKGRIDECRIAKGKLLRVFRVLGASHFVYERLD